MPRSVWWRTMAATAPRNWAAAASESKACGPSRSTSASRSGGRGRLPAWVVRMRSLLCFMVLLFDLHVEFANVGRCLAHSLSEYAAEFVRRCRRRDAPRLLQELPVLVGLCDRSNVPVEKIDDGFGRAGNSANAEPAVRRERIAAFVQCRNLRKAFQPLRAGCRHRL